VAAIIPKMEMVVPITDKVIIFVGRKSPIPRLQLKGLPAYEKLD
jgi:hypothetical protein